jgi:hypothetical protein
LVGFSPHGRNLAVNRLFDSPFSGINDHHG